jgi:hypothetical protein
MICCELPSYPKRDPPPPPRLIFYEPSQVPRFIPWEAVHWINLGIAREVDQINTHERLGIKSSKKINLEAVNLGKD